MLVVMEVTVLGLVTVKCRIVSVVVMETTVASVHVVCPNVCGASLLFCADVAAV